MGRVALTLAPPVLPTGTHRREKRRRGDSGQLACDLTHIASLPSDAQHTDVTSHVQPGAALPKNVRTFEVTEGPLEIACIPCGK